MAPLESEESLRPVLTTAAATTVSYLILLGLGVLVLFVLPVALW